MSLLPRSRAEGRSSERRSERRSRISIKVELGESEPVFATARDINTGGLRLEFRGRLPDAHESDYELSFRLGPERETLHARARLVWMRQIAPGLHHAGFRFTRLTPAATHEIARHMAASEPESYL